MKEYIDREEVLKHKRTIEMPGPFGKTYTGLVVNAYHVENAPAADVIPADEVRKWLKKADEVFMKSCLSIEAYTAWQKLKEYFEEDG